MRILVSYRAAPRIRTWETGALISKAFRQLGHEVDEYAKIYERPEWIYNRNDMLSKEYDLHIYCECNDSDFQYLELKNINAKRRVAWLFDVFMMPTFYKKLVEHMEFDHCYSANVDFLEGWSCPASYLPYAADKELFYRPSETAKTIDVCLVGSDRAERRDLIKTLKKENINAQLITGVFKEDYINTLAASKIVVNDIAGGGANLLSMRVFEATAAGAMLLQAITPALYGVLADGVGCSTFKDQTSLAGGCKFYLENNDYRHRVTKNGQDWVLNHESYINRAQRILQDQMYA